MRDHYRYPDVTTAPASDRTVRASVIGQRLVSACCWRSTDPPLPEDRTDTCPHCGAPNAHANWWWSAFRDVPPFDVENAAHDLQRWLEDCWDFEYAQLVSAVRDRVEASVLDEQDLPRPQTVPHDGTPVLTGTGTKVIAVLDLSDGEKIVIHRNRRNI